MLKLNLQYNINPINAELNPTCHLLALLGAHPILHISRIRVKKLLLNNKACYKILIEMTNKIQLCRTIYYSIVS